MKAPRRHIVSWSTFGIWHPGPPPPNGCLPGGQLERYLCTIEAYEADYYGRGAHLYIDQTTMLQSGRCVTVTNLVSTGNTDYIQALMAGAGIELELKRTKPVDLESIGITLDRSVRN